MSTDEESPAKWALDLYDHALPPDDRGMNRYIVYFGGALAMQVPPILRNGWRGRPFYAGISTHITYGIVGAALAHVFTKMDNYVREKKDATMRHYVSLYPERFPQPPRPKFADVLWEWTPVR